MKKLQNQAESYYYHSQNLMNELQVKLNAELMRQKRTQQQQPPRSIAVHVDDLILQSQYQKRWHQSTSNIENISHNVSNNNSPLHENVKSTKKCGKNSQEHSKRDFAQSVSQQKLSSILGFMAGRQVSKASNTKNSRLMNSYVNDTSTAKVKRKSSGFEAEGEVVDPIRQVIEVKNLRKNQSMSEMQQIQLQDATPLSISPALLNATALKYGSLHQAFNTSKHKRMNLSSQSFQRPVLPTNKNNKSLSNQDQLERHKYKLRSLLSEREALLVQDQSEIKDHHLRESKFYMQFNQALHSLCVYLLSDSRCPSQQQNYSNIRNPGSLPMSTQDSVSNLHLEHAFKTQIKYLNEAFQHQAEKQKLEGAIHQLRKKNDQLIQENSRITKELSKQQDTLKQMQSQIESVIQDKSSLQKDFERLTRQIESSNRVTPDPISNQSSYQREQDPDTQELKYLIQGQFEAIQKLLQREQLVKVFLKRVGDSNILQMFEQFITSAEQIDGDDTEGNINVRMLEKENTTLQQAEPIMIKNTSPEIKSFAHQILNKYQDSYKQLNLCDSLMADDSRVNDSEESSFRFYGKEQGSDTSYQPNYLPNYVVPVKKSAKVMKDKLRINMMDLQLIQANQRRELQKQLEQHRLEQSNAQRSDDQIEKMLNQSYHSQQHSHG